MNLFCGGYHTFSPSQVHYNIAALKPLDETVNQLTLTVFIFVVDVVPFSVFDPLYNDLFGHLDGNPAK